MQLSSSISDHNETEDDVVMTKGLLIVFDSRLSFLSVRFMCYVMVQNKRSCHHDLTGWLVGLVFIQHLIYRVDVNHLFLCNYMFSSNYSCWIIIYLNSVLWLRIFLLRYVNLCCLGHSFNGMSTYFGICKAQVWLLCRSKYTVSSNDSFTYTYMLANFTYLYAFKYSFYDISNSVWFGLIWFYGTSPIEDYLMSKPFLYI